MLRPFMLTAAAVSALVAHGTCIAQGTARRSVSIRFRPMVGAEEFTCGRSYQGVGTSKTTITPSDFAFYVHDVKLVTAAGAEVPVALTQDSVYQNGTLALLDFENGAGPCSNGNAAMHTSLEGTVPTGQYVGVRFSIGVPFERNHLDLATQPSPLSMSRMFWAWNSGHKFARFDAKSDNGKSWVLHLGSSGCTPTGNATVAPTACAQRNEVPVRIDGFNVDSDVIIADAAALLAGNGGDGNQVCMSSQKSATCAPIFAALGLPFNGTTSGWQTFLRRGNMQTAAAGIEK